MGDPITTTMVLTKPMQEQREATKDMRRASRARMRLMERKQARERLKQMREAQQVRAATVAQGAATGTTKSSTFAQATGSIQSQLASNLSFLNDTETFARAESIFSQRAVEHSARADRYQQGIDIGFKAASIFAGGGA